MLKKVFIGIPALDGKFDARFMDALLNTIREGLSQGIDFCPYFVTNDPLIERVRNDILHVAYQSGIENCIFIDSDIVWKPEDIFKLLLSPKDVIGAAYRTKDDVDERSPGFEYRYAGIPDKTKEVVDGLMETTCLGMGFVKVNRTAFKPIYEEAPSFFDFRDGQTKKAVFRVEFAEDACVGEDVVFFRALDKKGIKVYIDTSINIGHIGLKVYKGNLQEYLHGNT